MRMLRAPGLALTAALLACALAGCSDADGKESSPEPTTSASASPTASAPTEPSLPAAADTSDEAGARAFLEHYWDLVNYAQATGDVDRMRAVSATTCSGCSGIADALEQLYADGGHLEGGEHTPNLGAATKIKTSDKSVFGYRIKVVVTYPSQVVVSADNARDERRAGEASFMAYVQWIDGGRWRLDILDAQ
ncbi:hypothetical protein KG112_05440 [Nocardioides sp. zg-ZUI104]|uniref:DUF6318 family protein n=1 Tax=Nocardioides faecalis TaxID=2803858 RepID=UPI001BD04B80|nr:DUF6318 family protein [Nocardioides faecalis]MBS4752250.1 hypothetical protein [Nocardioides faecalis]